MKRYRLKKDLPTFKAGDIFRLEDSGNLVWHGSDNGESEYKSVVAYMCSTLNKFPDILTDWFEEIMEESKTVWDLKENDRCYVIRTDAHDSAVIEVHWNDTWAPHRIIGNVFLTREEAEKELARRKAKQILLRDTKGFKADWKNSSQNKTLVYYDSCDKKLKVIPWSVNVFGGIYFATSADADESVEKHEKEWRVYLGVEE